MTNQSNSIGGHWDVAPWGYIPLHSLGNGEDNLSKKYKSIFDDIVGVRNEEPIGAITPREEKEELISSIFGSEYLDEVMTTDESFTKDTSDWLNGTANTADVFIGDWNVATSNTWTVIPTSANLDFDVAIGMPTEEQRKQFDKMFEDNMDELDPLSEKLELPDYVFDEQHYLDEIRNHVNKTYETHYGQDGIQATEVIIDAGHGTGFNIGNIIKYAKRYGKKDGYNRADILKIVHYAIIQLYVHDRDGLGDK